MEEQKMGMVRNDRVWNKTVQYGKEQHDPCFLLGSITVGREGKQREWTKEMVVS